MIGVNVFAVLVGPFDFLYKTNYFYLRSKPANPSLLDFLGPWPVYIAGTEAVRWLCSYCFTCPCDICARSNLLQQRRFPPEVVPQHNQSIRRKR